jgi:small nuclear ribonucleoprotein (snRNP)-like protein
MWLGSCEVGGSNGGFDPFLNIVMEDTLEVVSPTESKPLGSVVSFIHSRSLEGTVLWLWNHWNALFCSSE